MLAALLCSLALACSESAPTKKPLGRIPEGYAVELGTLRFAENSSQFACVVKKGKKLYPLVGAKVGDDYDEVRAPEVHKDGAHVAFRAMKQVHRGPACSLIFDGKVLAEDDEISDVVLSPADGTPAFWVNHGWINNADGSLDSGPGYLQFGKGKGKKWQWNSGPPTFTADGKWAVAVGTRGGMASVFRIDARGKEDILAANDRYYIDAVISPDGRELACCYRTNMGLLAGSTEDRTYGVGRLRVNDPKSDKLTEVSPSYTSAGSPLYSDDSKHLAFKIRSNARYGVVLDGALGVLPEHEWVADIQISPDGTKVAYLAGIGCNVGEERGGGVLLGMQAACGSWIVVNDKTKSAEFDHAVEPRWSPDGKQLAYIGAAKNEWRVFVGAKQSPPCEEIAGIVWAADGKSLSFGCRNGAEIEWCTWTLD